MPINKIYYSQSNLVNYLQYLGDLKHMNEFINNYNRYSRNKFHIGNSIYLLRDTFFDDQIQLKSFLQQYVLCTLYNTPKDGKYKH